MAKTYSCILVGLDVVEIEIETIVGTGFSGLTLLGLRSDITRDMRERVRSALESVGIPIPAKRVVVNISPQEILKLSRLPLQELDFAVAASIVLALFADQGIKLPEIGKEFFSGELTLSGLLKTSQNILIYEKIANIYKNQNAIISLNASSNQDSNKTKNFFENYESLSSWISERKHKQRNNLNYFSNQNSESIQEISETHIENITQNIKILLKNPKTCVAILIALAGNHHLILAGEPGIGKSFSIQKIKHLLVPPTLEQKIEIKLIYTNKFLENRRPFRAPHHSSSTAALVGGHTLKPGEVTLAHHGVLFLDEIAEFSRHSLEALREPLDSGQIELSKAMGSVSYPAKFLLCATTNPCPCGYFLSYTKPCVCKPTDSRQYISKISGPLLDRFCLQLWMEHPNSMTENSRDIFSNYLLNLNESALKDFSRNFFVVQTHFNQIQNFSIPKTECFFEKQISLRAQNKITRLKYTFQKIFPSLAQENNFTDDILKYRNFNQFLSKDIVY